MCFPFTFPPLQLYHIYHLFPIVPVQTMDEVLTVYIKKGTFKHKVPLNLLVYIFTLLFVTTVIARHCVWGHKFRELYCKHPTPTLGQSYPAYIWKTLSINNHITVQCSCMFLIMRLKFYYRSCGYLHRYATNSYHSTTYTSESNLHFAKFFAAYHSLNHYNDNKITILN